MKPKNRLSSGSSDYENQIQTFILSFIKDKVTLSEFELNEIIVYFNAFPVPGLVIGKCDLIWNRLIFQEDSQLCQRYIKALENFAKKHQLNKQMAPLLDKYSAMLKQI